MNDHSAHSFRALWACQILVLLLVIGGGNAVSQLINISDCPAFPYPSSCCCVISGIPSVNNTPCVPGVVVDSCETIGSCYVPETPAPTADPTLSERCCCTWSPTRDCLPGFLRQACTAHQPSFSCDDGDDDDVVAGFTTVDEYSPWKWASCPLDYYMNKITGYCYRPLRSYVATGSRWARCTNGGTNCGTHCCVGIGSLTCKYSAAVISLLNRLPHLKEVYKDDQVLSGGRCYDRCRSGYDITIFGTCVKWAHTAGASHMTCPPGYTLTRPKCYPPCPCDDTFIGEVGSLGGCCGSHAQRPCTTWSWGSNCNSGCQPGFEQATSISKCYTPLRLGEDCDGVSVPCAGILVCDVFLGKCVPGSSSRISKSKLQAAGKLLESAPSSKNWRRDEAKPKERRGLISIKPEEYDMFGGESCDIFFADGSDGTDHISTKSVSLGYGFSGSVGLGITAELGLFWNPASWGHPKNSGCYATVCNHLTYDIEASFSFCTGTYTEPFTAGHSVTYEIGGSFPGIEIGGTSLSVWNVGSDLAEPVEDSLPDGNLVCVNAGVGFNPVDITLGRCYTWIHDLADNKKKRTSRALAALDARCALHDGSKCVQCLSGSTNNCLNGAGCSKRNTCVSCHTSPDSCLGSTRGIVCVSTPDKARPAMCGCEEDDDCESGSLCDRRKRVCQRSCLSDSDCPGELRRCGHSNTCVECSTAADCPARHACSPDGTCSASCSTSAECFGNIAGSHCHDATSTCGCVEPSNCAHGLYPVCNNGYDAGLSTCTRCFTDFDCSDNANSQQCSTSGTCSVDCVDDSECLDNLCVTGKCRQCRADSDCEGDGVCTPTNHCAKPSPSPPLGVGGKH